MEHRAQNYRTCLVLRQLCASGVTYAAGSEKKHLYFARHKKGRGEKRKGEEEGKKSGGGRPQYIVIVILIKYSEILN